MSRATARVERVASTQMMTARRRQAAARQKGRVQSTCADPSRPRGGRAKILVEERARAAAELVERGRMSPILRRKCRGRVPAAAEPPEDLVVEVGQRLMLEEPDGIVVRAAASGARRDRGGHRGDAARAWQPRCRCGALPSTQIIVEAMACSMVVQSRHWRNRVGSERHDAATRRVYHDGKHRIMGA